MSNRYNYCKKYKELKNLINDIIDGVVCDYDFVVIADNVQDLYEAGKITNDQYDELMGYVQDLM